MCFIFVLSTDGFSADHTGRILEPLLLWVWPSISHAQAAFVHHVVRKGAHLATYGIFALLVLRAFRAGSTVRRWPIWIAGTLAIVAAGAFLDEYHQSFTGHRTASITDSMIDVAGGAVALSLAVVSEPRKSSVRRRRAFGSPS